ncbi:MAG TPA: M23 family metallopeptidase [Devosia sp.]|nr:M23 family metallopeptidase [Devosia sp.]
MRPKVPAKPFGKPAPEARKAVSHRLAIPPLLLYLGFGGLLATNVVTLVGLLMAPDISRLISNSGQSALSAYEDRLAQLRLEVDRLQSRRYAQAGDINLQLQELAQTQELLLEQHQYVKQLADKAAALGLDNAAQPAPGDGGVEPAVPDAAAPAGPDAAAPAATDGDAGAKVAEARQALTQMMDESRLALATLSDEATTKTDKIIGALAAIGIKPTLPAVDDTAEGGPLLPPVDGVEGGSLIDDANTVEAALERFKAAKAAADLAPIHRPVATVSRVSSIFGNRKDPFTGRLAFHSGIDFAAPMGTIVLSAGAGTVSFVGQMSGYGNVVEVTHPDGLVTRYGHLSAFLVKQGDAVSTGSPIARVGSTGRSTGPHLHFEVRREDMAVDPARYLNAGRILQRIVAS